MHMNSVIPSRIAPPPDVKSASDVVLEDSMAPSWGDVEKQDDVATAGVIRFLGTDAKFAALAKSETADILDRDAKDAEALEKGIALAVEKGIIGS